MKNLSKKLTGKKIRDEMRRRKMTVRDLQDALELDSPQSIYKWLRGESFPSLPNMLVLGELFQVPLETLLIREDGSPAYHRIFDGGFPYHIGLLFQEKDDFLKQTVESTFRSVCGKLLHKSFYSFSGTSGSRSAS